MHLQFYTRPLSTRSYQVQAAREGVAALLCKHRKCKDYAMYSVLYVNHKNPRHSQKRHLVSSCK